MDWNRPQSGSVFNCNQQSLEVLRLAVFNKDGKVEFTQGTQIPSAIHLPGWKKLFSNASNRFTVPAGNGQGILNPAYATLSLNENIKGRNPTTGNQRSVVFPFARDSRVRTPYAEAILSSFLNYSMRAAFDHDFAATGQIETPVVVPPSTVATGVVATPVTVAFK